MFSAYHTYGGGIDLAEKKGIDRKNRLPKGLSIKTDVPLDIALSLLKLDELEKLKRYVVSYLANANSSEV